MTVQNRTRTVLTLATLTMAILVFTTAPVSAGVISYVGITSDADCDISADKVYTHTLDFGTGTPGALINGVQFNAYSNGANGTLNFNRVISSGTLNDHGGNGNHNVSGSLANLLTDMYYNGGNTPGGTTTWTISGLTPGLIYETRIYTRRWGASARTVTFVFDPDGAGAVSDSTGTINEDDATTVGFANANDAYYISYQFTAVAGEDLAITLTQDNSNQSWHLYGLTNEVAGSQLLAYYPTPGDGAMYVGDYVSLQWNVGSTADTQDVYFGTNYNDVANGTGGTHVDNVPASQTYFIVGAGLPGDPLPGGLVPGKTYYWRVDEIEAGGVTKHIGHVWSFSIPSSKAREPQPADGAKYVDPDVQLTWTAGLNAVLHTVYFGDDYDTIAVATETPFNTYDPPGTLERGKTYYWRVDELDSTQQLHTGDVWSFETIPDIPVTDPNLLGWWKLDEGMGGIAVDWSGHENHGTINNPSGGLGADGSAWDEDPDHGTVLSFNGDESGGTYIAAGSIPAMNLTNAFTWSFWSKQSGDGTGVNQTMLGNRYGGTSSPLQFIKFTPTNFEYYNGGNTMFIDYDDLPADIWLHHAVVKNGTSLIYYRNGVEVGSNIVTADIDPNPFYIGGEVVGERWRGWIYSVRIYDKALTPEQVVETMLRGDPLQAWDPAPANSALADIRDVSEITWAPGDLASQHDVYWGASREAVDAADITSPQYRGRQGITSYQLAGLIEFGGGPYYWRIDEVNTDATITKGRTWTFSILDYVLIEDFEDYSNTYPNRVFDTWFDGTVEPKYGGSQVGYWWEQADLDAGADFLENNTAHGGNWSAPFYYHQNGKTYSEIKLPLTGAKRDWTQQNVKALSLWYNGLPAQGGLTEEPVGTYTITGAGADIWGAEDEFHFAHKTLSGTGSIIARVDQIIMNEPAADEPWVKAGVMIRETLDPNSAFAALYITSGNGCRFQLRRSTAAGGESDSSVTTLAHIQAPHWIKIERGLGGQISAYDSNDGENWYELAWSPQAVQMATDVYIGLAITSHTPGLPATAVISNVSTEGNVSAGAFAHQDIGIVFNDPEPMSVSITDGSGKVAEVSNPDPNAANVTAWTELGEYGEGILLSDFVAATPGFDLSDVASVSITFGTDGPTPGPENRILVDDIRLYGPRCIPDLAKPLADINSDCVVDIHDLELLTDDWLIAGYDVIAEAVTDVNLEAQYSFENNLLDGSGNGYTGDPNGLIAYAAGQSGQALDLDGTGFMQVDAYAGVTGTGPRTCAAWIRTMDYGEIVSWGEDVAGQKWIFRVQESNGTLGAIRVEVNGGYSVGDTDVRDGLWHHVVAVLDESAAPDVQDIKLYVDGVLEYKSATLTEPIDTATTGVVIVGKSAWGNRPFTGQIDDVRIYSRAVPQAEIANLAGVAAGGTLTQPLVNLLSTRLDTDVLDDEKIDFKDYATLVGSWLDEILWP